MPIVRITSYSIGWSIKAKTGALDLSLESGQRIQGIVLPSAAEVAAVASVLQSGSSWLNDQQGYVFAKPGTAPTVSPDSGPALDGGDGPFPWEG